MAGVASLFFYVVVLVVSVTSVLFGLDWLSTPPAPRAKPPAQVAASTVKPPAPAPKPIEIPVKGDAPVQAVRQMAKPAPAAPPRAAGAVAAGNPLAAAAIAAQPATVGDAQPDTTTAIAAPAGSPRCDVQACAARYRSFRASDCTWQPFEGPRRLCTKGRPQARATHSATRAAADMTAANQAQARACNVAACERAYTSFDRADCTYQPYNGPRRFCAK